MLCGRAGTLRFISRMPMICAACSQLSLVRYGGSDPAPSCRHCVAPLRVVPSCSYTDADVELFEELNETVAHNLQPLDAYSLAIEVEHALCSGRASVPCLVRAL